MNIVSLIDTLTELERQSIAANVEDKRLVTQRLRRLTAALEPKCVSRSEIHEMDDLLFDNVPV